MKEPRPAFMFRGLGLEFPIPWWAVSALGVLVVVSVSAIMYFQLIAPHIQRDREGELLTRTDADRLHELEKHFSEPPEKETRLFEDRRGTFKVVLYGSDNCLVVKRKGTEIGSPEILAVMKDPSRVDRSPAPRYVEASSILPIFATGQLLAPSVHAAGGSTATCEGRCADPHSGDPRVWNGERKDCWIQVWRQWPDGCTHYQWWNSCGSYWDTDENGRPRLNWSCCVH